MYTTTTTTTTTQRMTTSKTEEEDEEEERRGTTTITAGVVLKKGPNHECCDQTFVKNAGIATCLPWYGPRFSPHDVPNFYDVSGICENPKAFKAVVDVFVERYEKSSSETDKPTKIAGFDARGFLFGPTIATRLGEVVSPFLYIARSVFANPVSDAAARFSFSCVSYAASNYENNRDPVRHDSESRETPGRSRVVGRIRHGIFHRRNRHAIRRHKRIRSSRINRRFNRHRRHCLGWI